MSESPHDGPAAAIVDAVARGELRSAARLISRIEAGDDSIADSIQALYLRGGRTPILGITGPPGAGKSTLVDQLIASHRAAGRRVVVLAVDPSSPFTGGAILGDRVRMGRHNADAGVFIRSMAARGRLGGLAGATGDALIVLDAMGWDAILVETVGVGQSEIEILRHAHTVVIVQTPAGGDSVQAVKAGVLEVGDVFVVNKADAPGADRTVSGLREAIEFRAGMKPDNAWVPPILKTQAVDGSGIGELVAAIDGHRQYLQSHPREWALRLRAQMRALLVARVAETLRVRHANAPSGHDRFEHLIDDVLARRCDPHSAAVRLLDLRE